MEMDFGTSPGMGRSPSGSLGSSESLTRSRTGSLGNSGLNNKMFWSPKVEQINEDLNLLQHQHQSPSAKFIQQRLLMEQHSTTPNQISASASTDAARKQQQQQSADYMMMGAKDSSDYSLMTMGGGVGNVRLGHDPTPTVVGGGDYVSMDTGSKNDYVIMNSRQKFLTRPSDGSLRSAAIGVGQDVETSSGYSSTGDCSIVAETMTSSSSSGGASQKPLSSTSIASSPSNYVTSPKIGIVGAGVVQPSCRLHDVQGEEELMRRLARVEMTSPKHSPPAALPTETYVNLNFVDKSDVHSAEAIYENMNLQSPVLLTPTKSAVANLTVQDRHAPSSSSSTLSVKRSHSLTQRSESPTNHARKFSENQPGLVIVPADQQQQAPKSPKARSPTFRFFSSFGRGPVKGPKHPASSQSGSKDDSSSACVNTPIASPLPQRCLITTTPPPGHSSTSTSSPIPAGPPSASSHIEYASLDLNAPQNVQAGRTNSSPKVIGGNNGIASATATNNVPIPQIFTTSDEKDEAVIYSQIDVNKSEGLKKAVRQC